VEKEKPRSNHLPRINGYLHGLYYTLKMNFMIFAGDLIKSILIILPKATRNVRLFEGNKPLFLSLIKVIYS
ncbi:hypothetical protein ABQE31_21530, partial [Enterococcus avium]|uniref:hypothetical protein n=1 Tax=Enterococcus avium TaxID=33945 RepID=UPI0032E4A619